MQEKEIERYLVRKVKQAGGRAYKFVSPGSDGVPDRLVCLPGGCAAFVELKAPGKKPRPMQMHQICILQKMGFRVEVIDSKEGVDSFMAELSADAI